MTQPPTRARRRTWRPGPRAVRGLALLALVPTLAAVLVAALGPIQSGDLWWHLRTGRWILEHGALPTTDPFSHTAGDTPWVLQEYGSQVLFALVHGAGERLGDGALLLKLLTAGLASLALWVLWLRARMELRAPWAAAAVAAFALLYALKWELRPHLLSLFFFLWLERALFDAPTGRGPRAARLGSPGPRRWLEHFLLAMLWVQLHAEALFAPLLVLAVTTGALVATLRERAGARHLLGWLGALAAATLGSLASPLIAEPHRYALVGRAAPQLYIEEWFRPWVLPGDPRFTPLTLPVFALWVAAVAVGGAFTLGALVRRLRQAPGTHDLISSTSGARLVRGITWERLAFLAACLLFTLSARRFLWLAWFPLLDGLVLLSRARSPRLAPLARQVTGGLVLPLGLALAAGLALAGTKYPADARAALASGHYGAAADPALLPTRAADFVVAAGLAGNLFHPYEWGGYLGWRLGDAAPVFVDGRTVLFEEVIPERWRAERDEATRAAVFPARDVELVVFKKLVDHGAGPRVWSPNAPGLAPRWVRVWTDGLAVVWAQAGSPNLERAAAWWADQGVRFDRVDGITEAALRHARPDWPAELEALPPELLAGLDAAEAEARGGLDADRYVRRARFWLDHGMRRNLRAELRALAAAGHDLSYGGDTDPDLDLAAHLLEQLDAGREVEALEELEMHRALAPHS